MKYRDYKQSGADGYFHVFNRGNNKQDIFLDKEDHKFFILRLRQNLFPDETLKRIQPLPENSFGLVSFCLMPNHFHFLLKQNSNVPPGKLISRLCTSYSIYFNKKYERVGHVFQGAFKQILVDNDGYLLWLTAYIHANPVIAGLAKNVDEYAWSSYNEYLSSGCDSVCTEKSIILHQFNDMMGFIDFTKNSLQSIKDNKDIKHLLGE